MATENLKTVLLLVTKLVKDGDLAFKDGFQWTDVFNFIPELTQIPVILKNKEAISAELKSLTPAEIADLGAYLEANLSLSNARVEGIIESVIEIGLAVIDLVVKLKPTPVPTTPPNL